MKELDEIINGLKGLGIVLVNKDKKANITGLSKMVKDEWNILGSSVWDGQKNSIIIGKLDNEVIDNIWEKKKDNVVWLIDEKGYHFIIKQKPEIARWIKLHMWDKNPEARVIVL